MRTLLPSTGNWYGRCVLASGADIEAKVFQALNDPHVNQQQFDQLVSQWIQATNPALHKVRFDRKRPGTKPGDHSTVFLSGQNSPSLMQIAKQRKDETGNSNIGLIVQPYTRRYLTSDVVNNFDAIAIDNGMFTPAGRKNFDWNVYEKMIKIALAQEKRELMDFHFFTVPDEPFNWGETMRKFQMYRDRVERLRRYGAPAAVVLQNGANVNNVPWDAIDSIFIGGDDAYKVGPDAKAITQHAQKIGMNIHMGRVNTMKRVNVASEWGVNSADGTFLMHEFAKSLYDLEQKNPPMRGEMPKAYADRIGKMFLHGDHEWSEKSIVEDLVHNIIDRQMNNPANRRYRQMSQFVGQLGGRPADRQTMMGMDHGFTPLHDFEPHDDVVEYDEQDNLRVDPSGRPLRNRAVFDAVNAYNYREDTRVPIPGGDMKEKIQNTNRIVQRWRDAGVLPR